MILRRVCIFVPPLYAERRRKAQKGAERGRKQTKHIPKGAETSRKGISPKKAQRGASAPGRSPHGERGLKYYASGLSELVTVCPAALRRIAPAHSALVVGVIVAKSD
jgi:hypothetical protein